MRERKQSRPTLRFEQLLRRDGYALLAGVDEAGRGSWAGPVVAAAVILPMLSPQRLRGLAGVRDSKQLTPLQRIALLPVIQDASLGIGIGWATHRVVDEIGLAAANRLALQRAVQALPISPDALLIDHFHLPGCSLPQTCIDQGDAQCLSIAAASIVAKVFRDRHLARYDLRYPGYGFAGHKGYGTASHRAALVQHGPSPVHRLTFAPVATHCR